MGIQAGDLTTNRSRRVAIAALASLPVLPLAWFLALQAHPIRIPAAYLGYFLVVIAIPGTIFWRRLTGGSGWFTVDAVLGSAFGLAVEALVYPVGRWLDVPVVALMLPALALGITLGLPRPRITERPTPWWVIAGVMVAIGVVAAWFIRVGSRLIPLEGAAALRPNSDSPYQLALAGELTHHFPPQVPYVAGEPLTYHWMVYNHIASAHWISGIELDVLTQRVVPLGFLILTALGAAAVAMVLTGRALAGPIAAGLTVLAGDLSPWPWTTTHTLYNDSPLSMGQLLSPTQAFSTVLMLPLIAVTALLLRRKSGQSKRQLAGLFLVAAVLIVVLSVTKATALPVYAGGLAAAWLYLSLRARRINLRTLVLGVLVGVSYTANFLLVLRGARHGMEVEPAETFQGMLRGLMAGAARGVEAGPSLLPIVAVAVLLGWLMPGVGAFLIRRRIPGDPMAVLLVSGLIGAIAAAAVLHHASLAQVFFARSAFVYGVLIATWGLSSLERRQLLAVGPALLLGAAAIYLGRSHPKSVIRDCRDTQCLERLFAEPLVVALLIAAGGVVVLGLLVRGSRRTWAALAVAALVGMTVSPTVMSLHEFSKPAQRIESIPPGGIEAARVIRLLSDPDDLIATNIHCFAPRTASCYTASFWIAAYAERRVLVQGWAYTAKANAVGTSAEATHGPFWDQEKLRINDEAFTKPTRDGLETLRTKYGVRWLLFDERVNPAPPALARLADLRFQFGTVRVYQLHPVRTPMAPDL